VIAKEDSCRRGRTPGEVAALLAKGAAAAGLAPDRIHERLSERDGAELAMGMAKPGDLVVLFADDVTSVWKQVIYWGKERRGAEAGASGDELRDVERA
jgi:cyanophycin synthetase